MVDGLPRAASFDHKNEDFSKSVCSFESGAIFYSSLCQELSIDAFVVSILSSERISDRWEDFLVTPKNQGFHEISSFPEIDSESVCELLGSFWSVREASGTPNACPGNFWLHNENSCFLVEIFKFLRIFGLHGMTHFQHAQSS